MAAASGSGGARSPPAAAATRELAVVDDLLDVRDFAARLHTVLQESPPTLMPSPSGVVEELMHGLMTKLSSAVSALHTSDDVVGGGHGAPAAGGRRKKGAAAAAGGAHRRTSFSRRRSKSPFLKTVTAKVLEDGHSWRKYGQKHIQGSPNPRSYFRCTHRPDQGCMATRQVQVQQSGDNPPEFLISYFGEHTCRDPSTIPLIIQAAPVADDWPANLISFGSSAPASASTSTTGAAQRPNFMAQAAVDHPVLPGSYSEEALSSSSPAGWLAAVVGSTAPSPTTVGSAPAEIWPAGTGSFPSSPSSLGFMTGSFGSFGDAGDDDMFGFDP